MKKLYLIVVIVTALTQTIFSQVAINNDGSDPAGTAMLDIKSTSRGLLIPRLTTAQRSAISSPATGLLVYDSDENHFYYYDGSSWFTIYDGDVAINDLSDASSDEKSIFLGYSAGVNDDGANYNTCIGYKAAFFNTSGTFNNSLGYNSLYSNSSGQNNVAIGAFSLYSNTTGSKNVALGNNTNYFNQEGSQNVMLGNEAGKGTAVHNKSGDVFIGYQAGYNETGSNKLYIENSNSSTPLIYGEFDNDLLRVYGTLDINNAYQFPLFDGTSGQMLETDGAGNVSWSSSTGATQINDLDDGKTGGSSVFLGMAAGYHDDGSSNENVGVGNNALNNNTSGEYNVGLGYQTMYYNTTGNMNTAVGYQAGKGTTSHSISGNIFLGYQAGFNESGNNKLYIENSNSASPLIYGEFDNDLLRINGTLDINNAYQFPTTDGTLGQVLETDGSGNLSWAFGSGATQINELSDGKTGGKSVFLGTEAGNSDDGTTNYNVGVGYQALKSNSDGENNVGIGYAALSGNVSGDGNTVVGFNALSDDNSGYNTAIGANVLSAASGANNSAVGSFAMAYTTTGIDNTALGYEALYHNFSGSYNTTIGSQANFYNETGGQNTIIGYQAGYGAGAHNNISGNVFIGYQAGYNETGNNKLYIENSNSASPLIYGEFDNDLLRINGTLDINNAYQFPTSDGTTGQGLQTNGSGSLTWSDINIDEINELDDAVTNTSSVFLGSGSGTAITSGEFNTATGINAMNATTSGGYNTAFGHESLYSITTGDYNTAIGYQTLKMNNESYNTAIGYQALLNCNIYENTAVGCYSLKSVVSGRSNTACGKSSLESTNSGSYNTSFGYNAAESNTTGSNNTGMGYNSLSGTTTGSYNTAVGALAGTSVSDADYTGAFGYGAAPGATGKIKIGDNLHTSWIGGNSEWHNVSDGRFKRNVREDVPGLNFILKLRPVTFQWNNEKLERFIGAADAVLNNSDAESKALVSKNEQKICTGFIAQEVEEAAQKTGYDFDGVYHPQQSHDVYSLAYAEFVVPLVKAVQEQQKQIDELKQIIKEQQKTIRQLERAR